MITGKRTRLRAIEREDIPRFVTWLNDREVLRGLLLYNPMSVAQEENWYENILKQPLPEQPLAIDALVGQDWLHIGNCGLHSLSWKDRCAEVGIFIGEKQFWSQGFGSEAMELMLYHAFADLNLNRIYLHVYENNPRAIHSYEKVGFVHEGRLRQDIYKDGQYLDVLVMGMLRAEWQARQI